MASATAQKPASRTLTRDLCEDIALAMATGSGNVDRVGKVLKRVKMLGGSSPNVHDVEGVSGTDYLYEAVQKAAPIYEGLPAFSNHPPRDKADEDRDINDAMGMYHNVVAERCRDNPALGELYGDLHLVPSGKLTESMLDVATNDKLKGLYKLSHNARGSGEVKGGRYVITNIQKARSCDVVDRGATTTNLFESERRKTMATKKLGQLLTESTRKLGLPFVSVLMEMDDLMSADVAEPVAGEGDEGWKDHLVSAVGALVKTDDEKSHAMAKKILAMLAPEKAEALEEADEEEDEGEDGKPKKKKPIPEGEETDEDKKKKDEKEYKESLSETQALVDLLLPAGMKLSKPLIESAARFKGAARLDFLKSLKELAVSKNGNKPPPGAPRNPGMPASLHESAQTKVEDFLGVSLS